MGEFDNPKNMMVGSNNPLDMMRVAFHWSPSLILMLLYLNQISNLVKMVVSLTISMRLDMRGNG